MAMRAQAATNLAKANPKSSGTIVIVVVIICVLALVFGLKKKKTVDAPVATPAPAPEDTVATPVTVATPEAVVTPVVATPPTYVPTGYTYMPPASLPKRFSLKNVATGKFWSISGTPNNSTLYDGKSYPNLVLSADTPSDMWDSKEKGFWYRLNIDGTKAGDASVRHAGYVMWGQPFTPNNFDFAWMFFKKTGTTDQVIVYNPFDNGIWVNANGDRILVQAKNEKDAALFQIIPA